MKTNRIFFPNYHLNLFFKLSSSIFKRLTIFNPSSLIFHLILIFNLSSLILISSCSKKGTDPGEETVTFSGKITLEGQTDHSGVTIALYKPVELDTALVRINQQYPNIGVQISQETEFDHREHTPVVTTVSDAGGNWKIENVAQGQYNVVASKDGYGWQYYTGKKANQNVTIAGAQLLVIEELSQPIYNNYTFQSNRTYHVTSNTVFNTPVFGDSIFFILEASVKFVGNGSQSLTISDLNLTGNSNNSRIDIQDYSLLILNNSILNRITRGLRIINIQNLEINKLAIYNTDDVFYCNQIENLMIKNSIFHQSLRGIEILGSANCRIEKNIISQIGTGIEFSNSAALIENNYLINGNFGIIAHAENELTIMNNVFDHNSTVSIGILGATTSIIKNHFKGNTTNFITINSEYLQQSYIQPSVVVSKNNLVLNDQTIGINLNRNTNIPVDNSFASVSVEAKENFWNYFSDLTISEKIFDVEDLQYLGKVVYVPYFMTLNDSAGIKL